MRIETKVSALLAALLLSATATLHAEEDRSGLAWMTGDEIKSAFSDQKLAGMYPSNRLWSETIRGDGTSDYREAEKHWMGEWWVETREFCFRYPPPGVGGCFRVTRVSENCYELYEFSGPERHEETPPFVGDRWNGRMWHADRPTTCEARPVG